MKNLIKFVLILSMGWYIQSCSSTRKSHSSVTNHGVDSSLSYGRIRYGGGNGSSKADAIKILNAKGEKDGVDAEYYYIKTVEKKQGNSYSMVSQALIMDSLVYDKLIVKVNGKKKEYWFDISDFFGKF